MVSIFSENGEILVHYNKYISNETAPQRNTLSTYLRDRVSGKSIKIGLKFKNIPGSEKNMVFLLKKKCVVNL